MNVDTVSVEYETFLWVPEPLEEMTTLRDKMKLPASNRATDWYNDQWNFREYARIFVTDVCFNLYLVGTGSISTHFK